MEWQPIVKVEHYRLKQNSVKHPVELKEDPTSYNVGGNNERNRPAKPSYVVG
jgi:hypothetical protein